MVKSAGNLLEIEIGDQRNRNLFFQPLQRKLRGRFDLNRCCEPLARVKAGEWSEPIPGQRLVVDLETGETAIVEPLYDPAHAPLRERIEARGMKLPPERERFEKVCLATWLFYIARAVKAGKAVILRGEIPAELPGEPTRHFATRPIVDPVERLAAAMEKQNELLAQIIAAR